MARELVARSRYSGTMEGCQYHRLDNPKDKVWSRLALGNAARVDIHLPVEDVERIQRGDKVRVLVEIERESTNDA